WSMGFEYYWKTETVVRQNSVRRDLHRFGLQLTTRSGRARNGLVALARDRLGLPRISGSRPRKHCPAAPAANVATDGQAATPPHPRPDVLGRVGDDLAALAVGISPRPTRYRRAMASRVAPSAVGSAPETHTSWSPGCGSPHSNTGRGDGIGQPLVGRSTHSRRASEARRRDRRAHRVERTGAPTSSALPKRGGRSSPITS